MTTGDQEATGWWSEYTAVAIGSQAACDQSSDSVISICVNYRHLCAYSLVLVTGTMDFSINIGNYKKSDPGEQIQDNLQKKLQVQKPAYSI